MGRSSVLIAVFAVTVAARADDDVDRTIAAKKIKNYWRPDGRTGKVLSRKRLRDNKERRLSSFLEDFLDFFEGPVSEPNTNASMMQVRLQLWRSLVQQTESNRNLSTVVAITL